MDATASTEVKWRQDGTNTVNIQTKQSNAVSCCCFSVRSSNIISATLVRNLSVIMDLSVTVATTTYVSYRQFGVI